jgi:hypothetical protein
LIFSRRIRRYCAKWYESNNIPYLIARDRKAWAAAGVELYSSDEDLDYEKGLPDPIAVPTSPKVNASGSAFSSADAPSPWNSQTTCVVTDEHAAGAPSPWNSQTACTVVDEHEGNHSSADEATLAEPQSWDVSSSSKTPRTSDFPPITITEPSIQDSDSTSAQPKALDDSASQSNLKVPVPVLTILKTDESTSTSELKRLSSSVSVASRTATAGHGDKLTRQTRATLIGDGRSKEEIALPSRVFRAFIATKTQKPAEAIDFSTAI